MLIHCSNLLICDAIVQWRNSNLCLLSSMKRAVCLAASWGLASASEIKHAKRLSCCKKGIQFTKSESAVLTLAHWPTRNTTIGNLVSSFALSPSLLTPLCNGECELPVSVSVSASVPPSTVGCSVKFKV